MKDLYFGDFNPPEDGSSSSKGILEKEKSGGGDDDMLSRVFLAVFVIGIMFFLYT